jgi:hypothetical protein
VAPGRQGVEIIPVIVDVWIILIRIARPPAARFPPQRPPAPARTNALNFMSVSFQGQFDPLLQSSALILSLS